MLGTLAALAVSTMNSNAAVFGLQESGYGSPGGGYPTPTPEQLQAFYGAAVGGSTGSSGAGVTSSGNELRGGGGSSTTEPGSPITSPYGLHSESRNPPPETKYEPSHSPTHTQSYSYSPAITIPPNRFVTGHGCHPQRGLGEAKLHDRVDVSASVQQHATHQHVSRLARHV